MKTGLIEAVKNQTVYIQTHNFPDPDALASGFGLQKYLEYYQVPSTLCYDGKLERASAKRMLEKFGIQIKSAEDLGRLREEDCVILVDSQNLNTNVTDIGGHKVACVDHHPIFAEYHYQYSDIQRVGACASIIASYFHEDGLPIAPNLAAALAYGIKMDTADFTRGTTVKDTEMFAYLFAHADWHLVQNMYNNTLEFEDLRAYEAAIQSIQVHEKVGFAYIPFECQPALIAIISDFMKALDEVDIAIIYARQNEGVRFSVRSEDRRVNVGILVKEALRGLGDGGGHYEMAGGFIPLEVADKLGDGLHAILKERFMQGIRQMWEMDSSEEK